MRAERLLLLVLLSGCDASTRDFGERLEEGDAEAPANDDGGLAGDAAGATPSVPPAAEGGAGGRQVVATGGSGGDGVFVPAGGGGQGGREGSGGFGGSGGSGGSAGASPGGQGGRPPSGNGGLDAGSIEPPDGGTGTAGAAADAGEDSGVDAGPPLPLGECEVVGAEGMPCQDGAGSCVGGQCVVPDKATLGEPCTAGDECGSGNCAAKADGTNVCCNTGCAGTCEACDDAGQCSDWPADDEACAPIVCPADSACSDYPTSPTDRCAAFGTCFSVATYCQPQYETSGVACGSGLECDGSGNCESVCSDVDTWCVDACVDLETDSNNCGTCGEDCTGGKSCLGGDCVCDATETDCSGTCADTEVSNQNCGECGTICPAGSSCVGGDCTCPTVGHTLCGASCVDVTTSPQHCGVCNNGCTASETCVQGNCKSWGTPYRVGSGPAWEGFTPTTAIDPAGNVFVGFMTDDTTPTFVVRRRSAAGTWSAEQIMGSGDNTRGNFYTKGRLGTDAAGNAFVTWGGEESFGYSRYRASTSSWVASAYLTQPPYYDSPEYLSVASGGDAYIAWDNSVASAGTEAWMRRWNGTASAWASAQEVTSASAVEAYICNVGADANGNGLVVYSEETEVYARWWQASTQAWAGPPVLLNEGYCFASLAFDGQGTSVITAAGSSNIYGSSSSNLSSWTTEPLAAPGEFFSYRNHVTAFAGAGGDAVVTLEEVDTYTSITTTRWSEATGSWQGITTLMAGSASEEFSGVAMDLDSKGNGFVATVSSSSADVVGKVRDGATGDWGAVATLGPQQGPSGTSTAGIQLDVNALGSAVLVWVEQDPDGNFVTWARIYE